LVDASTGADLLVVGTTGAGALTSALLGSVAHAAIRRSACPVLLVPAPAGELTGRVIVGFDGSDASADALAWAVREAVLRAAEVVIVHAWSIGYSIPAIGWKEARHRATRDATTLLQHGVELATAQESDVRVVVRLVENAPSAALLDEAAPSDLLVVGSRGHGALRSALLGSVARAVTDAAKHPVVVVRHTATDGQARHSTHGGAASVH
jgi:nucleotide-binding universal stress UspA family protein